MQRRQHVIEILLIAASTLLLLGNTTMAIAQEETRAAEEESPTEVRLELKPARPLFTPDGPMRLRFAIVNESDRPVALPSHQPLRSANGIALPEEIVFGTADAPALRAQYEQRRWQDIVPPKVDDDDARRRPLRLAPGGVLGVELDVLPHHMHLRYAGNHTIEWTPCAGRWGTISTTVQVEPRMNAIIVTDYGKMEFRLEYEAAPHNIANFLELVRNGLYDGLSFHRIVPGFVAQGGCPKGTGTGVRPDGKTVRGEFHDAPVDMGTLVMTIKPGQPDSASCQFFIALARLPQLDGGAAGTVIGQAADEETLRTLHKLASVPTDAVDRPLTPVKITSINLVDAERGRTRHLGPRAEPSSPSERPSNSRKTP